MDLFTCLVVAVLSPSAVVAHLLIQSHQENRYLKWVRGTQCGPEPADFAALTYTTNSYQMSASVHLEDTPHLTGHVRRSIGD